MLVQRALVENRSDFDRSRTARGRVLRRRGVLPENDCVEISGDRSIEVLRARIWRQDVGRRVNGRVAVCVRSRGNACWLTLFVWRNGEGKSLGVWVLQVGERHSIAYRAGGISPYPKGEAIDYCPGS